MSATPTTHDVVRIAIDRSFLRGIVVALAVGGMLALTSAFGMSGLTLTARLAYWLPLMLAGAVWGQVCSMLVDRWIDMDRRPWLSVVALTVIMSGPLSILVWAVTRSVFSGGNGGLLDYLGPVVIVTTAVSTLNVFLARKPVQTHAAPVGAAPARFPDRLPMKLKGAMIRAVESEDHYLRIHTDRGSDLILMRLSDALIELEGLEGAQTHRGWWVAREAVRGVSRGDGRATLTLDGNIQAPVSRRYAKALRDAGWY